MSLSSISVDFTANVGQFASGLQQMRQQTQDFQDDITDKLNTVKDAFQAFLAVEAFKQFGEAIIGAIDNISAMSDAAAKLGISAESYQALSMAAKEVGVDMGTAKTAFTNINKEIEAGANGNVKAINAFNELGLSISALQQMSPEQQFAAISDAFAKMPDGVDKTAAGIEIFKKSFAELRPLLDQGAEGLSNASTNAADLGQLLSNVDVKNVKEAHTAIGELEDSVSGLFNIAAATFAPFITSVITPFLDWLKQSKVLFDVVDTAIVVSVEVLQGFGTALDLANAIWDSMNVAIDAVALGVVSLAGIIVSVLNEDLKMVTTSLNTIIKGFNAIAHTNIPTVDINIDGAVQKLGKLTDAITQTMKEDMAVVSKDMTDGNAKAIGDLGTELQTKLASVKDGAQAAGEETGKQFMAGVAAAQGTNAQPEKAGQEFSDILSAFGIPTPEQVQEIMQQIEAAKNSEQAKAWEADEKLAEKYQSNTQAGYQKELDDLKRLNDEKLISDSTYYEKVAALSKQKAAEDLKDYENQHTWATQAIGDMTNFAGSMAQAVVSGKNLGTAMKQFFSQMLTQVAEQIVKWMMLEAIMALCGFAGSAGVSGASDLAKAIGNTSTVQNGPFGGGKATGGTVSSNTAYMVGEQGPEMFTPGANGYITPNNQLGGGGGNSTTNVNQTFNVQAGVSQTVRAEMMGMMPMFQTAAQSGVLSAVKRGGVYGRTIRGY